MGIYDNCKVLELAKDLSLSIHKETNLLEGKEHYVSGVASKMRNRSDKLVHTIRSGWSHKAGAKKTMYFTKALEHADEIERFIEISVKMDRAYNSWTKPKEVLQTQIVPKLLALQKRSRK